MRYHRSLIFFSFELYALAFALRRICSRKIPARLSTANSEQFDWSIVYSKRRLFWTILCAAVSKILDID